MHYYIPRGSFSEGRAVRVLTRWRGAVRWLLQLLADLADSGVVVVLLLLLAVAPLPDDPGDVEGSGAEEVGHTGLQPQPACTQSLKTTHTFF